MDELLGKRVFLTGGTGFFGKWLLSFFQALASDIVVLSRHPMRFLSQFPMFANSPNITFVQGDIRDFPFPDGRYDYVIHAATEAGTKLEHENPAEMQSVIEVGTRRVLQFSKQSCVKRLLYVSSGAVYGVQPPELSHVGETFPCNPVTAYGRGKLQAEQMCLASGVETVIARCFAFVGPWLPLDAHFAIGNFIGNCLKHESIEIKGDGTPMRSYMYSSDLVDWLLTLLAKGRSGEAYNVGSDVCISIADLAQTVRLVAGTDNAIRIRQQPCQGSLPSRYIPSVQKAKDELGLLVKVSLAESISQTIRWYRERGCYEL
ncbi:MAG: NAD(P)-dependent oxidoreductase [Desulfobulbus sp.]|nr:NAD(P)-dependent oxidoreductase [Desulfobulbus sp.]